MPTTSRGGIPQLDKAALEDLVRRTLVEDLGETGDMTSKRIIRIDQPARAQIVGKSSGILAGVLVAEAVFHTVDKSLKIDWEATDGATLGPGTVVADLAGRARAILAAERVALNFLMHLSGVASITSHFVNACTKHGVRVLCTRKTLPGLRAIERYAVAVGGGHLHRAGLFDEILIKTNHTKISGGVSEALKRTKANPNLEAEIEVTSVEELEEAMSAGADRILLDNASMELIEEAVKITRGKIFLEISGGVTLDNVSKIARLGPDAISVGAITLSAPAIDLALRMAGSVGAAPHP